MFMQKKNDTTKNEQSDDDALDDELLQFADDDDVDLNDDNSDDDKIPPPIANINNKKPLMGKTQSQQQQPVGLQSSNLQQNLLQKQNTTHVQSLKERIQQQKESYQQNQKQVPNLVKKNPHQLANNDPLDIEQLQKLVQNNSQQIFEPGKIEQKTNLGTLKPTNQYMKFQQAEDKFNDKQIEVPEIPPIQQITKKEKEKSKDKGKSSSEEEQEEEEEKKISSSSEKDEDESEDESDQSLDQKDKSKKTDLIKKKLELKKQQLKQKQEKKKQQQTKKDKDESSGYISNEEDDEQIEQGAEAKTEKDPNYSESPDSKLRIIVDMEISDQKQWVTSPVPKDLLYHCTIYRDKSGFGMFYPKYHMSFTNGKKVLLSAKKRSFNKTSNYLLSLNSNNFKKKQDGFIGKLRSNFVGTEFVIYDNGDNPKIAKVNTLRQQLGVILYNQNLLGAKGPRKMKVLVPAITADGPKMFKPATNKEGILPQFKSGKLDDLNFFFNKPPKWDEQRQAFVLNFRGRIDKPSVKNFQLINGEENDEQIFLQFGRVKDEIFNIDFQYPFTPLQAMAIALSSFDYKFACE